MGQLHIEHFGLRDVARRGGTVLVGVVQSITPPKNPKKSHDSAITLTIEQVIGSQTEYRKGATAELVINGGVVWDDPHKSPLDRRLNGAIGPRQGARVIAVPSPGLPRVELLPADEDHLRVVSILWDPAEKTTWLASSDDALEAGLKRLDLVADAAAELDRRGKLTASMLLGTPDAFLYDWMRALDPERRRRFLAESVELAAKDRGLFERVFRLATYEPDPKWISALAPLAGMVESERHRSDLHFALVSVAKRFGADLSAFADFLVVFEKHRPAWKSDDDDLEVLTSSMDARARAAVAVGFVESARTSSFSGGEYDLWLLREAARLAKESPDASLVAAMASIDPSMPRVRSSREFVMEALLEMGAAVVGGLPSERERVRDVIQPWLDQKVDAPKAALAKYREIVGEPAKGTPARAEFELVVGGSKRLPSGLQVRYAKRDDGWYEFSVYQGEFGSSWGLDPALDGYREFWNEPYVVVVDRVAGSPERVRVVVEPHSTKPKDLEDPEGCRMAEEVAEREGCPDREFYEHRRWEGRFEYRATGPGGKRCEVLIGTWTRRIVGR